MHELVIIVAATPGQGKTTLANLLAQGLKEAGFETQYQGEEVLSTDEIERRLVALVKGGGHITVAEAQLNRHIGDAATVERVRGGLQHLMAVAEMREKITRLEAEVETWRRSLLAGSQSVITLLGEALGMPSEVAQRTELPEMINKVTELRSRTEQHVCATHKIDTCVWLRDGTKVSLQRDPETQGRAWLEVQPQAVVQLAVPEPAAHVELSPEVAAQVVAQAEEAKAALQEALSDGKPFLGQHTEDPINPQGLPCPHGRPDFRMCPHCMGF